MKSKILFFVILIFPLFSSSQIISSNFYYAKGQAFPLELNKNILYISVDKDFNKGSISFSNLTPFELKEENSSLQTELKKWAKLEFVQVPSDIEYAQMIIDLKNIIGINVVSPAFINSIGTEVGTSSFLYVKLKEESDYLKLDSVAQAKQVAILGQNKFMPKWYTLKCTENTIENSLLTANSFYDTGLFAEAIPDLMTDAALCANDPDFGSLWGLQNAANPDLDINICEAWNITEGDGTIVAVVDSGIEITHDDLENNIHPLSYDSETNTSPQDIYGVHGTKVAGIIGAEKNNELQVVGVAPGTALMSVSNDLSAAPESQMARADAINWAWQNGADVINNSWNTGGIIYPAIEDAIGNALLYGRNGLGTIVVFASGNDNFAVSYPANSNEDILTVGAMDVDGSRWTEFFAGTLYGSNFGPDLDVVAPGNDILTTSFYNYTDYFEATSSAAPFVSGVAALVLAANPCLSGQQVRDIIEGTAQKVGSYSYSEHSGFLNGSWNTHLGYGLVDAHAAVALAQSMHSNTLDLMIKDNYGEFGLEPNTTTNIFWSSPDIWVRNHQDGMEEHENPEYSITNPPYVYVRITNKSCSPSSGQDKVKLYWAKANAGAQWPEAWNGDVFIGGVPIGDNLGDITIPALDPGEETLLNIPWNNMPNPNDYPGMGSPWHFCMLARIVSQDDPMTTTENWSLGSNVLNNNNIASKNVNIVDNFQNGVIGGTIAVINPFGTIKHYLLEFNVPEAETDRSIYEEAEVTIELDDILYQAWVAGGSKSDNLKNTRDENIKLVAGNHAALKNLIFESKAIGLLTVNFNFLTEEVSGANYTFHAVKKESQSNPKILGGETYLIKRNARALFLAKTEQPYIQNDSISIYSAKTIDEPATYNWYDPDGNLIHSGTDLILNANTFGKYKLEVIANTDGYKDYKEINIASPYSIISISPNPAIAQTTVKYELGFGNSAYVTITNISSSISNNYLVDELEDEISLDLSQYTTGLYIVSLVCNGQLVDSKNLVIQ